MKKPGLRNIKTALSVVICALTIQLFNILTGLEIEYFYAGITAVFTMQQTNDQSKHRARSRLWGTLIGAMVAIVIGIIRFDILKIDSPVLAEIFNTLYLFLGIIVTIWIIDYFNLTFGVMIGCVMVISSFTIHEEYYILYTILRGIETFYGAYVSLIINKYIFPYKK
ncbi:MAG: FUSC family protein [Mycoplasmatales bacterium]